MSVELVILEGTRGGGKSTVARFLRSKLWGSTLINMTGFSETGEEGLKKIADYYTGFFAMIRSLADSDSHYVIICDRTFFSEAVYSQLYKDYDFMPTYENLCKRLVNLCVKIHLFFLTADATQLTFRLNRDKVKLFDKVPENVVESLKQQEVYRALFDQFQIAMGYTNVVKFYDIDTSRLNIEEVQEQVIHAIGG